MNIALLVGGPSPERTISKLSSKAIYNALLELKHNVNLIDPAYGKLQPKSAEKFFSDEDLFEVSPVNMISCFDSGLFDNIDLVFIGLHGKWVEDGIVQSLLELKGLKYTGAGILSSAISMDKNASKIYMKFYDIKTPEWIYLRQNKYDVNDIIKKINISFGFPCVVKPNDQGSTIGLTVCKNEYELSDALILAFNYGKSVLIEEFISGREITVGILSGEALPVLEIVPHSGLYDYKAKYTDGESDYIVPAEIDSKLSKEIRDAALLTYNVLGCSDYGRVDFKLNSKDEFYCLELNTLPGMTSHSLVPKEAKEIGISFNQLIERIINSALSNAK